MNSGIVKKVSGSFVTASKMRNASIFDAVKVGKNNLLGEVTEIHGEEASIQVYDDTSGLKAGEEVTCLCEPLSIELGPGLLGGVFDALGRPFDKIMTEYGNYMPKGIDIPTLDRNTNWKFEPNVKIGDRVHGGDIIGTVEENSSVNHKIMLEPELSGIVKEISGGTCTVDDIVAIILDEKGEEHGIGIMQKWYIRKIRPYKRKLLPNTAFLTGQRAIDSLFPLVKGGTCAITGAYASGKTSALRQIAKFSQCDIIIYLCCGERGNEVAETIENLISNDKSVIERTVFFANTSDMSVAAREASLYTAMSVAEYFRDMGNDVLLVADSVTRWAEAMREMSAVIKEIPDEDGYPVYLQNRLLSLCERAGKTVSIGSNDRHGTITFISTVSKADNDLDPVGKAVKHIVKAWIELDKSLANSRFFPAIDYSASYSLYKNCLFINNSDKESLYSSVMKILNEEKELLKQIEYYSFEKFTFDQKLLMLTAQMIKNDFIYQPSFNNDDCTSLKIQDFIIKAIDLFYEKCSLADDLTFEEIENLQVRDKISFFKFIGDDEAENYFAEINELLEKEIESLREGE